MSSSTNKKVLVERFERETVAGFVNPQVWLLDHTIELLTPTGVVQQVPYTEIKTVSFVKDLEGAALSAERRLFNTRPKTEGLWVRMLFRDGDHLDGLLPNNLLQLEAQGFGIIPPDPGTNIQRVWIPKAALSALKVLGVIGSPLRRHKRVPSKDQITLFD